MVMASSTLPFASTRAFLQSSRPAPVWKRRSLTILAVMGVLMSFSLDRRLSAAGRLALGAVFGVESGNVDRDLDLREIDLGAHGRGLGFGLCGRSLRIGTPLGP